MFDIFNAVYQKVINNNIKFIICLVIFLFSIILGYLINFSNFSNFSFISFLRILIIYVLILTLEHKIVNNKRQKEKIICISIYLLRYFCDLY